MTKGNAIFIAGVPPLSPPRSWPKFGPRGEDQPRRRCRAVILRPWRPVAAPVPPHPAGSRTHIRPPIARPLVKMFLDWLSKFVGTPRHKFSEISLAPNSCNPPHSALSSSSLVPPRSPTRHPISARLSPDGKARLVVERKAPVRYD